MLDATRREEEFQGVMSIEVQQERVTILIQLLDEGVKCCRPVSAEHLSEDTYRIADTVPEGETWLFKPGEAVQCKQREFSNGTGLTAYESLSVK